MKHANMTRQPHQKTDIKPLCRTEQNFSLCVTEERLKAYIQLMRTTPGLWIEISKEVNCIDDYLHTLGSLGE